MASKTLPTLDKQFFASLVSVEDASERVHKCLASIADADDLLHFFVDYASWNGHFANGVAALTSTIGRNRDLFREPGFARAVSDRSNYVASFFFDAARDEYDDHINPLRDTHRCMAQASLICMKEFLQLTDATLDRAEPAKITWINARVMRGYLGQDVPGQDGAVSIFRGMGYHLGSELLADREFSRIDEFLRKGHANLVAHLMRSTVKLAGGEHRCYSWVGVHSGHGGGVEADHFDYACNGAQVAFQFLNGADPHVCLDALVAGFRTFDADHRKFFSIEG